MNGWDGGIDTVVGVPATEVGTRERGVGLGVTVPAWPPAGMRFTNDSGGSELNSGGGLPV